MRIGGLSLLRRPVISSLTSERGNIVLDDAEHTSVEIPKPIEIRQVQREALRARRRTFTRRKARALTLRRHCSQVDHAWEWMQPTLAERRLDSPPFRSSSGLSYPPSKAEVACSVRIATPELRTRVDPRGNLGVTAALPAAGSRAGPSCCCLAFCLDPDLHCRLCRQKWTYHFRYSNQATCQWCHAGLCSAPSSWLPGHH